MHFLSILLELIIGYIFLFLSTKFLGKTQINQITPFDFISALVLGELVGNAIYQDDVTAQDVIFAVSVWTALIFTIEKVTQKSRLMRQLFEGRPALIINKGQIQWNELKKHRLDIDQFLQLVRSKDVFSLQDVEYALLENNGTVSVLKKSDAAALTRQDFSLPEQNVLLPFVLISDGQLRKDTLEKAGLHAQWLYTELNKQGITSIKDVCYGEWTEQNGLYIQTF